MKMRFIPSDELIIMMKNADPSILVINRYLHILIESVDDLKSLHNQFIESNNKSEIESLKKDVHEVHIFDPTLFNLYSFINSKVDDDFEYLISYESFLWILLSEITIVMNEYVEVKFDSRFYYRIEIPSGSKNTYYITENIPTDNLVKIFNDDNEAIYNVEFVKEYNNNLVSIDNFIDIVHKNKFNYDDLSVIIVNSIYYEYKSGDELCSLGILLNACNKFKSITIPKFKGINKVRLQSINISVLNEYRVIDVNNDFLKCNYVKRSRTFNKDCLVFINVVKFVGHKNIYLMSMSYVHQPITIINELFCSFTGDELNIPPAKFLCII